MNLEKEFTTENLQGIARKADIILREELRRSNLEHDKAEARVPNIKTVGIKGDERVYGFIVEIGIYKCKKPVINYDFLELLSNRITNEVHEVVKVVYVSGSK